VLFAAAAVVIFLGVFTQSLSGFGIALVAMPLLAPLLGVKTAAPLVALVGTLLNLFMVIRYRTAFNFKVVWKLSLPAFMSIPIGVLLLDFVNQKIILLFLGIIVIMYSLYALLKLKLPTLEHPAWLYGAGFTAGLLGGMFNTNGPPVIIYGHCRGWSPAEFKVNLQSFFLTNNIVIIASHIWRGNITPEVITYFWYALPALLLGVVAGLSLDKIITPAGFQKLVLFLLLAIGVRLLF
jgi:uncharacterized membrane protein YfcA